MVLSGRVGIVTGAAQGIGAAIVRDLVRAGARVIALDRQLISDEAWGREIDVESVFIVQADVTSHEEMRAAVRLGVEYFGRLDIAVCNAGLFQTAPFLEIDAATWDRHLAVNLTGVFNTSQIAAQEMIAGGTGGSIVVITSINAESPSRGTAPYVAAKGGAKMLAEAMAWELGDYGIRVNCVAPGIVDTPLNADFLVDDDARRRVAAQIPIGRVAQPEDIARVVTFLASPASEYVTGVTVRADGGRILGWVP
jgi:glucose 1-dehydrogenase